MTIYLPDDLAKTVKAERDLNVSAVCQDALRREVSRRNARAGLDEGMERHVFRASGQNSSIPGMDIADGVSRDVAFTAKEIAGQTWATKQPWIAYWTKRHQIALWDDNGGLRVFSSLDDLRASDWSDNRPDVVAEIAAALGQDYVIDLDI